jgi:hypothetical protein
MARGSMGMLAARSFSIHEPTYVRQRVELHDLPPLWRVNPSRPDIRNPAEVLLVDCVLCDAGLILHRFCDPEALCSIGRDLSADLGPLAGAAQRRGLKDCRTSDHGWGENRKLRTENSVQHEIGGNTAVPKWCC